MSTVAVGQSITEYITAFEEQAEELAKTKLNDAPKSVEMTKQVGDLIEEFYATVGSYPKAYTLTQLANYLLVNELKDKDVDKVTNKDYPILSETQLKRRARKQFLVQDDTLDFLNTKFHKQLDSLSRKTVKKAEY